MMRLTGRRLACVLVLVALMGAALSPQILRAQPNNITLSLAIPSFQRDSYNDKLIGDFEAANPGVKVNVITPDLTVPDPALGLDGHFTALDQYAASADVLFVNDNNLSVEGTRAGYFLDLAPLVSEDKNIHIDDFYPPVWQSFQWDNGIWALPTAANVIVMTYKPADFDKAGLAYPSDKWTLGDLSNATTKLAQKDPDGTVSVHGIDLYSPYATAVLFRTFIGAGLYDASQVPNPPALDKPAVETMLDAYNKLDSDSLIGSDLNRAPLALSPATAILFQNAINQDEKRVATLLPGRTAGLDVQGFAISRGTQYPDQAYALASFLTTRAEALGPFASAPARKSLSGSGNSVGGFRLNVSPEVQAVIDQGVANGIPLSEVRFGNYLALAANKMKLEKSTSKAAIQEVETTLISNLKTAADKKDKLNVIVSTPVPSNTAADKVTLKFGLLSFQRPLPNKDKWDKLVQDFIASDPQVGQVTIDIPGGFTLSAEQLADRYDCFYLPFNSVPDIQNFGQLLNFDPYLSADKTFDKSDMIGTTMAQATRDNKIWALPIEIEPEILKYDSSQFDKAGVPAPQAGWTIDGFNDALKKLKPDSSAKPPFASSGFGGTHLLILIATYGGLPIDFRTTPPTLNYTDPKTVDAIKQVLDLAKSGYIKYTAIGKLNFFGGNARPSDIAIYNTALNAFSFRPNTSNNTQTDAYKNTTYPKGSQFNAVSYSIGTAYLSSKSQNADACYRWISTVARNPQLFNAMPARKSLLDDPAQATAQGADTVALYKLIATLIQDPNTLSIPSLLGARQSFFEQLWLYQAFDSYVLQNGDLESGLKDAQAKGSALTECVSKLAPYDPLSTDSIKQYEKDYGACVTKIDPSFKLLFGLIQ